MNYNYDIEVHIGDMTHFIYDLTYVQIDITNILYRLHATYFVKPHWVAAKLGMEV